MQPDAGEPVEILFAEGTGDARWSNTLPPGLVLGRGVQVDAGRDRPA